MKRTALTLVLAAIVSGCTTMTDKATVARGANEPEGKESAGQAVLPVERTEVRDLSALERLRGNSGLTLQWIDWNTRGILEVSQRGPVVHLKGQQVAPDGKGRLEIEGDVLSIEADHFIFVGRIAITDTPDVGRRCVKAGAVEFAITQGRKYWRMREFEWCDRLTDYIDIYF